MPNGKSRLGAEFFYSRFILVKCIALQRISNPRHFVKHISENREPLKKRVNCVIKKVLSVHMFVHWNKELGMYMTKMN